MRNFKLLLHATSFIVFIVSCNKDNNKSTIHPASKTLYYYNNSKIDTLAGNTINSGNFTVFEYNYVYPDNVNIADDEQSDRVIFQIPAGQTNFTITDSQLTAAILKRWHYCFCFFIGPFPNIGGSISGVKHNNTWQINGTIKTATTDSISISGNYQLK